MFDIGEVLCNISFRGTNKNSEARKTDKLGELKTDTVFRNLVLVSFQTPIFKNGNFIITILEEITILS